MESLRKIIAIILVTIGMVLIIPAFLTFFIGLLLITCSYRKTMLICEELTKTLERIKDDT